MGGPRILRSGLASAVCLLALTASGSEREDPATEARLHWRTGRPNRYQAWPLPLATTPPEGVARLDRPETRYGRRRLGEGLDLLVALQGDESGLVLIVDRDLSGDLSDDSKLRLGPAGGGGCVEIVLELPIGPAGVRVPIPFLFRVRGNGVSVTVRAHREGSVVLEGRERRLRL